MKKLYLLIALLALCGGRAVSQDDSPRPLKLVVSTPEGKKVKNLLLYAYVREGDPVSTLEQGTSLKFSGITDADTLHVIANDMVYMIPLEGVDSIKLIMKNQRKLEGYKKNDTQTVDAGFYSIPLKNNTYAINAVDVATINNYKDLASYIRGRVAGVEVTPNALIIRGIGSMNSSNAALIVVDGVPASDFSMVNSTILPRDVESITVNKDGTLYGVRGVNGVVIINTKSGGGDGR